MGIKKKLKQPKIKKNHKKFLKSKKYKMFVHAEINPQTMGWENFMTEMAETFGKSHDKNGWRCGSRPMETDNGTEWNQCGFKVFSTHVWTKEIEVPENIKPETIKAKMSAENILKISAERKDDHNIDIEIPNLD